MQLTRAADLVYADHVRDNDRILVGQGTAEPLTLTRALVDQADRLPACKVFVGPLYSETFEAPLPVHVKMESYGAVGRAANVARSGRLTVFPSHFSDLSADIADGRLPVDCVLLQLRPSLSGRGFNLGVGRDFAYAAARRARAVIVEINQALPACTGGDIDDDLPIGAFVEAELPPIEMPQPTIGAAELAIARHIAALVPDGAVLQTGVGTVPNAVLAALSGHRDLGLHSGAVSDGIVDLVERGAMTNARKEIDAGVGVTGLLLGTRRLYEHAHRNPRLRLAGPEVTHNLAYMARLSRLHAINSAIEVDLTGQVSSELADGRYVGAVGGQVDFVRAARQSTGGRAIIALPSTTRDGRSRIVFEAGAVTCARSDADTFVTEHGVAELRGQSLEERARRMIAIAAPEWREDLERAWRDQTRRPS